MIDQTPAQPSETAPAPSSILGTDPVEVTAPVAPIQASPATVEPVVQPTDTGKHLTDEEHAGLMSKAAAYDIINGDAQARQMVEDHFRARTGNGEQVTTRASPGDDQSAQMQQMRQEFQDQQRQLQEQQMNLTVQMFRTQNPDFEQHKEAILGLVQNNNMDLQTAYNTAKAVAQAGADSQNGQPVPQMQPTAETGGPGSVTGAPVDTEALLDRARAEINDPAKPMSMSDALSKAWDVANQVHGTPTE